MATSRNQQALFILVLAGEAVFLLPFVLPRVFRPTLLAVFEISNLELGSYFSAYGLVAIAAYFFGGPIADRFAPHKLMSSALFATACGGLYLSTIPGTAGLLWLYAGWGLSTILLFWAAMLRATRLAGGEGFQGRAFGVLEGGRGLVSAFVATLGVAVLGAVFPQGGEGTDLVAQREGFQAIALTFSALVFLAAIAVWFGLQRLPNDASVQVTRFRWADILKLSLKPKLWLLALIILCAYSGYRVLDDISLLASDVLGYNDVQAARLSSTSLFIRPIAAIGGGILADRYLASRMSLVAFLLMLSGAVCICFGPLASWAVGTVWLAVFVGGLGVYALRGLYFALVDEADVPILLTGTAVGLASVIGYLPDIFMPPIMGQLLDVYPGVLGHRLVFGLGVGFGVLGLIAVWAFRRLSNAKSATV
ncbi:MAG: nitrate/nitrite transporter [Saprospiraceae bacterium]